MIYAPVLFNTTTVHQIWRILGVYNLYLYNQYYYQVCLMAPKETKFQDISFSCNKAYAWTQEPQVIIFLFNLNQERL